MTTPDQHQASYENLLYPMLSYRQAHPNRLHTVARLLGMEPAPVETCRILELGCASGSHIIPIAAYWPETTIVGVDFGHSQIEEGQRFIEDLGLTNITLVAADVRDIDDSFGQFDYIIAHGLYSWVPADVRPVILNAVKEHLAPQGVAYISYNALPGWNMMHIARELMLYHTQGIDDPAEKVDAALGIIDFISENHTSDSPAYQSFLDAYQVLLSVHKKIGGPREPSSVYHDELETYNQPFYFNEFMAHAAEHGLVYLAEADFAQVFPTSMDPDVQQALAELGNGNVIEMETYMDFVRNRTFRQTLLVHADAPTKRQLSLRPVVAFLRAIGIAHPPTPPADGQLPDSFVGGEGIIFRTDHPISQAALLHLSEVTPQSLTFSDLMDAACARLGIEEASADDAEALALNLLRAYAYSMKLVDFEGAPSPFVNAVSDKPMVHPIVRYFAQLTPRVTNARHERVELDPITRTLVPHVDGQRTVAELVGVMQALVDGNIIAVNDDNGDPITDPDKVTAILTQQVDLSLTYMRRTALLKA